MEAEVAHRSVHLEMEMAIVKHDTGRFLLVQAADLSKPIDKRIYKGTQPTCHDFNPLTATAESVSLLVGFSAGQVQLIDPIKKETSKLFNEEVRCDAQSHTFVSKYTRGSCK